MEIFDRALERLFYRELGNGLLVAEVAEPLDATQLPQFTLANPLTFNPDEAATTVEPELPMPAMDEALPAATDATTPQTDAAPVTPAKTGGGNGNGNNQAPKKSPRRRPARAHRPASASIALFVVTYLMAASFCALVLFYQFSVVPEHQAHREELHVEQGHVFSLRAELYELFFLQQDFLNQELTAKLPPKLKAVEAFLKRIEKTASSAFAVAGADASVKRSFDVSFKNYQDLWNQVSAQAMRGDPEGAKGEFLNNEAGLRASLLESVETQVGSLTTGFQNTGGDLANRQTAFAYLMSAAGITFLLLFLAAMSAYLKVRFGSEITATATPAQSTNGDIDHFVEMIKAIQLGSGRLVRENSEKAARVAELKSFFKPLLDLETKYREVFQTNPKGLANPRATLGDFLQDSHTCLSSLWSKLGQISGDEKAEILSSESARANEELARALTALDQARNLAEAAMALRSRTTDVDQALSAVSHESQDLPKAS